jgi:hypothetical protein
MAEWLNPQQAAMNPETNNHTDGPTEPAPTQQEQNDAKESKRHLKSKRNDHKETNQKKRSQII